MEIGIDYSQMIDPKPSMGAFTRIGDINPEASRQREAKIMSLARKYGIDIDPNHAGVNNSDPQGIEGYDIDPSTGTGDYIEV